MISLFLFLLFFFSSLTSENFAESSHQYICCIICTAYYIAFFSLKSTVKLCESVESVLRCLVYRVSVPSELSVNATIVIIVISVYRCFLYHIRLQLWFSSCFMLRHIVITHRVKYVISILLEAL